MPRDRLGILLDSVEEETTEVVTTNTGERLKSLLRTPDNG